MPSSISTCLLVGAACVSGVTALGALGLVALAVVFEIILGFGS